MEIGMRPWICSLVSTAAPAADPTAAPAAAPATAPTAAPGAAPAAKLVKLCGPQH